VRRREGKRRSWSRVEGLGLRGITAPACGCGGGEWTSGEGRPERNGRRWPLRYLGLDPVGHGLWTDRRDDSVPDAILGALSAHIVSCFVN
jgi:hypothetical protein